jgi:pimeloyl-ACP methyl ester carboxylesterase
MRHVRSSSGALVSYDAYGSGPPLVLVHGAFSDHHTNWEFVRPLLGRCFTIYAVARRGRGQTDVTTGHSLEDEAHDVVSLIREIDEPVFLLGHSYGGHVALLAAAAVAIHVRKLVVYEPADPRIFGPGMSRLEPFARAGDWDGFALTFFRDLVCVPVHEIEAVRASPLWAPIVTDGPASLNDLRALSRYEFRADRFRTLPMPVTLQIGTESPRQLYVTDALAPVVPDVAIQELPGQAHEGMTTAPEMYTRAVVRALLESSAV